MKNKWEIVERLSDKELENKANSIANNYVGGIYEHKNGGMYKIIGVGTININGTSYWGFAYVKTSLDGGLGGVDHTRPIHEFLDGRFTLI